MALTQERRNELAWIMVFDKARDQGIPTFKPNEFQRELKNAAKRMGIDPHEAMEFARELYSPLFDKLFQEKE